MIWFLRVVFLGVLVTMLLVTGWASSQLPVWRIPREVALHPWFIATLFDTYFAFLTFFLWVAYKEANWWRSIFWLVAILLLGNIAIASYMLIELFGLPAGAKITDLLLRRK